MILKVNQFAMLVEHSGQSAAFHSVAIGQCDGCECGGGDNATQMSEHMKNSLSLNGIFYNLERVDYVWYYRGRVALQSDRLRNAQTIIVIIVAKNTPWVSGDECRRGRTGVRPAHLPPFQRAMALNVGDEGVMFGKPVDLDGFAAPKDFRRLGGKAGY